MGSMNERIRTVLWLPHILWICKTGCSSSTEGWEIRVCTCAIPAEAPTKVVVFAHHRRVLDALAARLRELRMGCLNTSEQGLSGVRKRQAFVRIDGSVPEEERHRRRRLFLSDPACNLAIISISASSHGVCCNCWRCRCSCFTP